MGNINKLNLYLIRVLFIIPWFSILVQMLFIHIGYHRFKALSYTNKTLALLYIVTFFVILFSHKKIGKHILSFFFLLYFLALYSFLIFNNNIISIVIDVVLLSLQAIFLYFGYYFSEIIRNKYVQRKIIKDNIIIAILLGIIYLSIFQDVEIVNPSFGLFILASIYLYDLQSLIALLYFFLAFLIFNIVFSFGKQNFIVTFLTLLVYKFFLPMRNYKNIHLYVLNFFKYSFIFLFIFAAMLLIFKYGDNINAVRKLKIFINNFKYDLFIQNIEFIYNNPYIVYEFFDLSTAGRLSEFFIALNTLIEKNSLLIGNGLGIELDFSERDKYTFFYEFEKTRSVQTLFTFLISRFGIIGYISLVVFLLYLYFRGVFKDVWGKAFLICLVLSMIAFSTVFKYHYMMFFLGVALSRKRRIQT